MFNLETFHLNSFSDAGKVANEGDPHLKAAANKELYDLEKRTMQNADDNSSPRADDEITSQRAEEHSSQSADDDDDDDDDEILQTEVSPRAITYSRRKIPC